MMLKMKYLLTSVLLLWLHSLSKCSEEKIYLSEILDTMKEEWIETYVTALFSLCHSQLVLMCDAQILQGNITVEPIFPRDESNCCLTFDCFGSCSLPNTNCSNRIQSFHSSTTRQYLDYTLCMDSYKYQNDDLLEFGRLYGSSGHIIVSFCPENTSIDEKILCENKTSEELRLLEDTIPVTANDVHFANRYCASCHGQKSNYVFWDLKIGCTDISNELHITRENLNTVIKEREDCYLQRVPPVDSPTLPTCKLNVVSTCNETGKWKTYNKKIENLCLDPFFGSPFIRKTESGEKRYKNIFCALCNGITKLGFEDCMGQQVPPSLRPDFTMLISFSTEKSSQIVEEMVCPLQHIFVPLANGCMKTQCSPPMLTDILHNTCSHPPPPAENAKIKVDYAFKVRLNTNLTLSSRFELEKAIAESFSMFNNGACILTFAYELDNLINECNDDIDGNFEVVYFYVQSMFYPAQHHEVLDVKTRLPPDKSVIINGTISKVQYLHYENDPSFIADEVSWLLHQGFHSIHNPYSKTTIIVFQSSDCYDAKKADRSYSITYIDCPSILLSLQMFDIERIEHGLLFKQTDTNVPFSDFRTFNSTHVYVCQEALLAMKVVSKAGQLSLNGCILTIAIFVTLLSLY